jgi:hypothetical protein
MTSHQSQRSLARRPFGTSRWTASHHTTALSLSHWIVPEMLFYQWWWKIRSNLDVSSLRRNIVTVLRGNCLVFEISVLSDFYAVWMCDSPAWLQTEWEQNSQWEKANQGEFSMFLFLIGKEPGRCQCLRHGTNVKIYISKATGLLRQPHVATRTQLDTTFTF